MKVKVISRNPDHYLRETKKEIHKGKQDVHKTHVYENLTSKLFTAPRNYDPALHPFEAAREYVRALNAVKLERVFAKPFVGNLDGHRDGISCLSKHPKQLSVLLSGAYDGEVRVWDIPQQLCLRSFVAHEGIVRGISYEPTGSHFFTLGDDKTIKTWNAEAAESEADEDPINTILSKTVLTGISYHQSKPMFATCGEVCQIWEETRSEPVRSLQWGVDSLHHVAFNPVQTNLLSACASDRSIILYDVRDSGPLRKVIMKLRTNSLAWNPMEAFIFTCANEDYK